MRERLAALDAFRGLTIAGMLLVNNPGTWSAIYRPLDHAPWHGWTPTDLIFPFFLFIVGITTHLSLESLERQGVAPPTVRLRILKRGLLIILLGLLLQSFPWVPITRITEVRFPGVLQRIGLCYLATAFLTRRRSSRAVVLMIVGILLGYWALQALVAPPGVATPTIDVPGETLSAWIDRTVFGTHIWRVAKTWDPEGLLSTVPAIGTVMLGVFTGRWIASEHTMGEKLVALYAVGALATVAGLMWNWSFPINKNLWTSSYVLFTAGVAALTLATCTWLTDVARVRWWTPPFTWFGRNPLIAFVGTGAMSRTIYSLIRIPQADGSTPSLQRVIYETAYASWLPPRDASLAFALSFVAFWAAILWFLDRRKVYWKV